MARSRRAARGGPSDGSAAAWLRDLERSDGEGGPVVGPRRAAVTPDAGQNLADTTVAPTAIAVATERERFGALVTPLARRRPWN